MKKQVLLIIIIVAVKIQAQVGIGTKTPHSSAILDLSSTNKGFLPSRVALTSKTDVSTISSPATGLLIYNTATAGTSPNNVSPGFYFFNGTSWVSFIENTPFFINNSTSDAGNNKTSALYRNGNIGINQSNPRFGIDVNNSLIRALNSSNSNQILIDPVDAAGPKIKFGTSSDSVSFMEMGAYNSTNNIDNKARDFRIFNNTNANALFVKSSGYIGIGTNSPYSQFSNTSSTIQGTNNISAVNGGFTWSSPGSGFSGSFYGQQPSSGGLLVKVAGTADSVFALQVGQSATQTGLPSPIFSAMASGRVGVGINYPLGRFIVNDVSYISAMPQSTSNLMDNTGFRPLTRFQTTSGANNNALSHYMTTEAVGTQAHNYSTGVALPYVLQPAGGNVGIGVVSPLSTLHVQNPLNATNSINANAQVLRLSRPVTTNAKWDNIAQFNLGSYSNSTVSATSRLDLALSDGAGTITSNVMTWQANGNVGIGVTAPTRALEVGGEVKINTLNTGLSSDSLLVVNNGVVRRKSVSVNVNIQTGNYTLTATDNAGVVIMNSATAVTVTVPSTLSTGFFTQIIQKGAGQVTVVGASGVTINSALGFKSRTQNSSMGVLLESNSLGYISGDSTF
jgi:hypothetical protein